MNQVQDSKIIFGNQLPEDIFDDIAKAKATEVFLAGCKKDNNTGELRLNRQGNPEQERNTSTQLRKFYDELVMWHDKIFSEQSNDARKVKFAELKPFIRMLNAKVAYATARKHVETTFEQMFAHVIKQIDSPDTLKHAKLFMEAFMGFYKAEEK